MPAFARRETVAEGKVGLYYCIANCGPRARLCGKSRAGASLDHRPRWIRDRIKELAAAFGIDVCGFAVARDGLHVMLKSRPDVVAGWSDMEVAKRWANLFPLERDEERRPLPASPSALKALVADKKRMKEIRKRLSSIPWLMRTLSESVARRCLREEGLKGHFWDNRYRCVALLDTAAALSCAAYVDLSHLRVKPSEEAGGHLTSVMERQLLPGKPAGKKASAAAQSGGGSWLAPISAAGPAKKSKPDGRASNDGFLPVSEDQYRALLAFTAEQLQSRRKEFMPEPLRQALEKLGIQESAWLAGVKHFGLWFKRAAGKSSTLRQAAKRAGKHWFHGLGRSLDAFGAEK